MNRPGTSADELRRWGRVDAELGLPIPRYDGRSLPNVAASIVAAATGRAPDGRSPPLEPGLDPFRGRRADGPIVLLVVDGLGWDAFRAWAVDRRPEWLRRARAISSVFPTTTTAALTSLSTASPPSRHGLVAYRQYLPRYGAVVDLLRMSPIGVPGTDLLVPPTGRPRGFSGVAPIFERIVRGTVVSRDRFQTSGFTRLLYDGAEYLGYATGADLAHRLGSVLARRAPPPVVYAYWDELDTVQHLRGPEQADTVALELDHVASWVDHLARTLGPRQARRTRFLITADHGQVPVDVRRLLHVDRLPRLARTLVRPLAGDRRSGFFAAVPGGAPALERELRRILPRGSRLVDLPTAIARGLFGPPPFHPEIAARTGDLLALVPAPWGLVSQPPGTAPPRRHLAGGHGGLDPRELVVPLIAGRLADLGTVAA